MTINRRKTLAIFGGGAILAAGGGLGAFAVTRTPNAALAPWALAGGYDEPRRRALSYAILAPNPHNRQPWMVDLATPGEVVLHMDATRGLPETDPFSRQLTIGLGCFLEILRMAAAEDGFRAEITPFPDGFDNDRLDMRPVARVKFVRDPDTAKDALFAHVLDRRSSKEEFDMALPVENDLLAGLAAVVPNGVNMGSANAGKDADWLRQTLQDAMAIELGTHRTYKESVDLFRIGKTEINANPDGVDLGGALFDGLSRVGLLTPEIALDPNSTMYKQSMSFVMGPLATGRAFLWLTTPKNDRLAQLRAGYAWVRINLAATGMGLSLHPTSQALQEYAEMAEIYGAVHERLAPPGDRVQMLGRVGYADPVPRSPRWRLEEKIMDA